MAKSTSNRRRVSAEADAPVEAVSVLAEPPTEEQRAEFEAEQGELPDDVERYDAPPPQSSRSSIVKVVPTANARVVVPSGASFDLKPGQPVRMSEDDARFLSESGYA